MSATHTAEHLFAGSIRRIKPDLTVLKVDQSAGRNSIYVNAKNLDWNTIFEAEIMANQIIAEGREVKQHIFNSLKDAKQQFPEARVMEERISGTVRIIEVDGYDYAACSRKHSSNTVECDYFLVTRVVKANGGYKIDFLVGAEAKKKALEFSKVALHTSDILGTSIDGVEKTVNNMVHELKQLKHSLSVISEKDADDISFSERGGVKIFSKVFRNLNTKIIMKKAGDLIKNQDIVVILANISSETIIILARSSNQSFDSGMILNQILTQYGGKGGGRPHFASGSVEKSNIDNVFQSILEAIFN